MADEPQMGTIEALIAEEHELRSRAIGEGLSDADQRRLTALRRELDQCWDLLRQRRARQEFEQDAEDAELRPAVEVESYQQ
jgi:hypothetical protein